METRVDRKHREVVSDVFEGLKTESFSMDVYDLVVEVSTVSADVTVTLPPVTEARGKIYTIMLYDADTNTCTITDNGDDSIFVDVELGDDDDYAILFSNGSRWFVLAEISDVVAAVR